MVVFDGVFLLHSYTEDTQRIHRVAQRNTEETQIVKQIAEKISKLILISEFMIKHYNISVCKSVKP